MGSGFYGLDGKRISVEEAGRLLQDSLARRVARTVIHIEGGSSLVISTVFLVLDHSHGQGDDPVLWETMIFGGPTEGQDRYTSREAALNGHKQAVTITLTALDFAGRNVLSVEHWGSIECP